MYSMGSTQKRYWTFNSPEELRAMREEACQRQIDKYRAVMEDEAELASAFLTPDEESTMCRIITETGVRFGDEFRPPMWPSVRWIAFAYFKRFYLHQSPTEYFPKNVMMGCYYLASKVDEFNVSIDQFVENLKTGTPESNVETVLTLEPVLMGKLRYHLTVHTPYRPFEGLMIEAKTIGEWTAQGFDLERIRELAMAFFKKALLGDAMLLYPPSQIALAAMKHGLDSMEQPPHRLRDFLLKLVLREKSGEVEAGHQADKLLAKLGEICHGVISEYERGRETGEERRLLKEKMSAMHELQKVLDAKLKELPPSQRPAGEDPTAVDSDDDD